MSDAGSASDARSMHPTERFAQEVILHQPNPPRNIDPRALLRSQITWRTWYQISILVGLIVLVEYVRLVRWQGEIWTIRYYLFYILVIPGWPIVIYLEFVQPWFRWRRALRDGRYRVAEVIKVKQPPWYDPQKMSGRWLITLDDTTYDLPFRFYFQNTSTWFFALAVGTRVHVLLHPTKPEVLFAFGIVHADSPNLAEANKEQLLAKLLEVAPPRDAE
jgi:hypothetical protein